MTKLITLIIAKITRIDWSILNKIVSDAPELISNAKGNTGWDKLKSVVEGLEQKIPSQFSKIASTVVTILVAIVRLYTLIKK